MRRLLKGGARRRSRASGPGKISAALVEFAQPLLDEFSDGAPIETVRSAVAVAVIAWNCDVLARLGRNPGPLETLRAHVSASMTELLPVFDELVARKSRRFADDLRVIIWHDVSMSPGELHVQALSVGTSDGLQEPRAGRGRGR